MTTIRPKNLPPSLTYPAVAVDAILRGAARTWPDRVAVTDGDLTLTFGQLHDLARRIAGGFQERSIGPGDVVALHMPNSPHFLAAYYGALFAGAAVAPVNPAQPVEALRGQLGFLRTRAIVTAVSCAHSALAAAGPDVRAIVGAGDTDSLPAEVTPLAELSGHEPLTDIRVDPESVAHLQLTGGTTGNSKAVRVLHRNLVAAVVQNVAWRAACLPRLDGDILLFEQQADATGPYTLDPGAGVHLGIAPLFHGLGLVGTNIDVALGNSTHLGGGFDPNRMLADIERLGVTQLIGSPAMYYALLNAAAGTSHDLSSVRQLISGAAPIDTGALRRLRATFPKARVAEGYGLSEATLGVSCVPINADAQAPVGSVGIPIFDTEVELRGADGSPVADGEVGEIWVRGPQVTDGYDGQPELTANQFRDGWLLTGDMARRDADGYLYIAGRSKDMVIYKGYNVYPQPLEDLLCSHPAVEQAAVVGRTDDLAGEIPVGFVVVRVPADEALVDDILTWVADRVAPYQKVRELHVVDALPVTPTGKVAKNVLREQLSR